MASRFEIVDGDYIEESKDKMENKNTKNSTEWWKNKVGEWKKLTSKFRRLRERCSRPTIVAVLSIQKFSNGGGSQYLCVPRNPKYDKYQNGHQSAGYVYGSEYEVDAYNGNPFDKNFHNHDAPCAVCFVNSRGSMLMMPARNDCPSGWTEEYHGYLMTSYHGYRHSNEFICVNGNPECRSKFTSKLALTLFIWTHQSVRTKQEYTCCSSQPKTIKTFKTSPLLRVNRSKTNDISSNFARLDLYGSKKRRENTKAKNTGNPAATPRPMRNLVKHSKI